jgi:hypothetical protein
MNEQPQFDDYLVTVFMRDYHGDKDHYEAAFDSWLADLDGNELIEYGNGAVAQAREEEREWVRMFVEELRSSRKEKGLLITREDEARNHVIEIILAYINHPSSPRPQ